jgi:hypothetical protein
MFTRIGRCDAQTKAFSQFFPSETVVQIVLTYHSIQVAALLRWRQLGGLLFLAVAVPRIPVYRKADSLSFEFMRTPR